MKKLIMALAVFANSHADININEICKALNAVATNLNDRLPEEFRKPDIKYMGAFHQQDGFSCGYWTLLNAKAINNLLSNNTPLDHKEISNKAIRNRLLYRNLPIIETVEIENYSKSKENIQGIPANNDELHFLAEAIDLKNINFLGRFASDNIIPHIESDAIYNMVGDEAVLSDEMLDQYYDSIIESARSQNLASNAIHFSCNIGGHWILISFIKENDNKYMLILDSANGNLTGQKDFIELLYNIFLTKFVPNF